MDDNTLLADLRRIAGRVDPGPADLRFSCLLYTSPSPRDS